jgi:hypothetical protein
VEKENTTDFHYPVMPVPDKKILPDKTKKMYTKNVLHRMEKSKIFYYEERTMDVKC